ncbi:MAG TPA: tRNA (adenosine(37)-N6)-dimethylallyltransferase MiaA [Puia sp.]|nr:tRNA (adenosine(37)-N6)-dimethylallyltransferase MiaA [Puia sp.]
MREPTIIIIVGPTAVGKTAAAIRLARQEQTSIISADSRQCYLELNIGVAKPSPAELDAVHHYFINSHSIRQEVNAALFEELALRWTTEIFQDKPTAVMVGGTGLYIKAFTDGLDAIPAVDPAIRGRLQQQFGINGIGWLREEVRLHDPGYYAEGERQNPQRLLRALEVRLSTGRSILSFRNGVSRQRPFHIRKIGLDLPKEELHRRIHARVDQMIDQGLLAEVSNLLPYRNHNALRTVGYREIFEHLDGLCSLDEAIANIKTNTRRYAKRQLTWFRKDPGIVWKHPDETLQLIRS